MSAIKKIMYYGARLLNRRPASVYQSSIDKKAAVGNGAQIYNSSIGRYSYIYNSKVINAEVGQFCSIAEDCTIGGGAHPVNWVSTSPVFYTGKNSLKANFSNNSFDEYARTIIGNDVWIGSKCLVKGGVKIGDGAIVGMGSVVTHDIPPFEIWAGNPAKFIRKRFTEDVVEKIQDIKWWNWSENELKQFGDLFKDPFELISVVNSFHNRIENKIGTDIK